MPAFHRTLTHVAAHAAIAAVLALTSVAHAQAAAASAPAGIDAEKQKLIDRILAVWHPENNMVLLAQRPAAEIMDKTRMVVQQAHLPADKADKTIKDIAGDVHKYVEAASPIALASAKKNIPLTISPVLAQNFSVDELRQLVALLESPINARFEKLAPQMERSLGEKVTAEAAPEINKQINVMTQAVSAKLRDAATAAASAPAK